MVGAKAEAARASHCVAPVNPTTSAKTSIAAVRVFTGLISDVQFIPSSIIASCRPSAFSTSAGGGVTARVILSILPVNLLSPSL